MEKGGRTCVALDLRDRRAGVMRSWVGGEGGGGF